MSKCQYAAHRSPEPNHRQKTGMAGAGGDDAEPLQRCVQAVGDRQVASAPTNEVNRRNIASVTVATRMSATSDAISGQFYTAPRRTTMPTDVVT